MMNELLDKGVGVQYPEELGGTIDIQTGTANCCKFNRWGSLVAVGCTNGNVCIVDFLTQKVAKIIQAHTLPISSISWSRDGRKLLTTAAEMTVSVWNVLEGTSVNRLCYKSPMLMAYFNPRDDNQCIVLPSNVPPTVEYLEPRETKNLICEIPQFNAADDGIFAVSYDRRGQYILTGSSKGKLIIYDAKTLKMITWVKQQNSQQIRQIYTPRRANFILTNTQDRVIRIYRLDDLLESAKGAIVDPSNKVLDIVNKAAWKAVCTDMEGNYICGASTKAHQLYIWERTTGTLVKMLNGTKGEALLDAQWHPTRPVILSVSNGQISVWTQAFIENWSAFAPDFTELEENLKYREKEGEFDDYDEDASVSDKDEDNDVEDEEIDVEAYKPNEILCSSDEEDVSSLIPDVTLQNGPLWFLPQSDIENPDQPPLPARDFGNPPRMPHMISTAEAHAAHIGSKPRRTK